MRWIPVLVVAALLALVACGPKVMLPPKVNLRDYEVIGIIQFESTNEGGIGSYATREFMEAARRDQGMVRIVELGTEADLLAEVNRPWLDQTAFKQIGEKYSVRTVIVGELVISNIRPEIAITPGLSFMNFGAEVDASLAVKLVETTYGASVWSTSASATRKVGEVSIFGGKDFMFNARDPEKAYGELVDILVRKAVQDFQVRWERQ